MTIPRFTAEASVYRSAQRYITTPHIAYEPRNRSSGVFAQAGSQCDRCEYDCAMTNVKCQATASAVYAGAALGCLALIFPPAVAACEGVAGGVYAGAIGGCYAWWGECNLECWAPGGDCCPVFCELGHCCSEGETCIPHGCCPRGRTVCGDTCCSPGDKCCGGECCPSHYFCRDGFCSEFAGPSLWPEGTPTRTARPKDRAFIERHCGRGQTPCGNQCCRDGLQCCSVGFGQVACMDNCLH